MRNVKLFVDLSSSDTGITILNEETNDVFCFDIKISNFEKVHDKNERALLKIRDFDKKLDTALSSFNITSVFIESPFVNSKFLNSSEMVLKFHGLILHKFKDLHFSFITPSEIKKIVAGKGNANKEEVIDSIKGMGYNLDKNGKSNDNIYDSFAILICYYHQNDKEMTNLNIHVI